MSGIPAWCVPGARVVCVDASSHSRARHQLTHGETYTIREVGRFGSDCGVWLREITNPPEFYGHLLRDYEPGWRADRFAPEPEVVARSVHPAIRAHEDMRREAIAAYGKETAAEVGKRLGVSRNIIIGHWYRARRDGELSNNSGAS